MLGIPPIKSQVLLWCKVIDTPREMETPHSNPVGPSPHQLPIPFHFYTFQLKLFIPCLSIVRLHSTRAILKRWTFSTAVATTWQRFEVEKLQLVTLSPFKFAATSFRYVFCLFLRVTKAFARLCVVVVATLKNCRVPWLWHCNVDNGQSHSILMQLIYNSKIKSV